MKNLATITKTTYITGGPCTNATINWIRRPLDAVMMSDASYILGNGRGVGELARNLFSEAVTVNHTNNNEQVKKTKELINAGVKFICEASFETNDQAGIPKLFCAVDILELTKPGHVVVYEVKSATAIKDINYRDIAFQVYVITQCGYTVDDAYLIHVNKDYVREDEVDPHKFFAAPVNISAEVFNLQETVANEVSVIREKINLNSEIEPHIADYCFSPYPCPFWNNVCKPTLPNNSIFDIAGMRISTKVNFANSTVNMLQKENIKMRSNPKNLVVF